jgi:hypothetical protein
MHTSSFLNDWFGETALRHSAFLVALSSREGSDRGFQSYWLSLELMSMVTM